MRVVLERDNVNDDFVVVTKIHKQHGDVVAQDEIVLDVETSKTMKEIRSPANGILTISLKEGDEIPISATLFEVGVPLSAQTNSSLLSQVASAPLTRDVATHNVVGGEPHFERELSRPAAELSEALGVDLLALPNGWVTVADVAAAARRRPELPPPQKQDDSRDVAERKSRSTTPRVPFRHERTTMRKRAEARNLSKANGNGTTSMICIGAAIDSSRLVEPPFLFHESIADVVVFEAARLLRKFPELNGFLLDDRTIAYYDEVNFGISFDSGSNLKVLALRNADTLSLAHVQQGFEKLLQLYESGATIEEEVLSTSTVTLSDLSRSSVAFMLPLLNSDQSLILGLTRGSVSGFTIYASFDHRVSEGLQVARFLEELIERIRSHYREGNGGMGGVQNRRCTACNRSMDEEVQARGRGFLRMGLPDGTDGYVCRTCFEGW